MSKCKRNVPRFRHYEASGSPDSASRAFRQDAHEAGNTSVRVAFLCIQKVLRRQTGKL
jgi:hypothetical protein